MAPKSVSWQEALRLWAQIRLQVSVHPAGDRLRVNLDDEPSSYVEFVAAPARLGHGGRVCQDIFFGGDLLERRSPGLEGAVHFEEAIT